MNQNVSTVASQARLPLVIALMVFVMPACAPSSFTVNPMAANESYAFIEEELEGRGVETLLGDGSVHKGRNLWIDASRTSWQIDGSTDRRSVPTATVWRIRTTHRSVGAGRGFLIGGAIGAGIGAATGDAAYSPDTAAIGMGALGGIVGLIIGSAVGVTTNYDINPRLTPPPSAAEDSDKAEPDDWSADL